jgi:replicative DNA helicase
VNVLVKTAMRPVSGSRPLAPPLPQSLEAERSILGAVLLENRALNAIVQRLHAADLFFPQHRLILASMIRLSEAQQPIDPVTLMDDLERRQELEIAGVYRTCRASRSACHESQT